MSGKSTAKALKFVCGFAAFTALLLLCALALNFAFNAAEKRRRGVPVSGEISTKPIFLIDAGHGGIDGGAVGHSGSLEKDINLAVSLKLGSLLDACGAQVTYTRTCDEMLEGEDGSTPKVRDIRKRVSLADSCGGTLVSIHMNSYPAAKYNGLQVFFAENGTGSDVLANAVQNKVRTELQNSNNREAKPAPPSVWLTSHVKSPAIIVECGFISNPEEETLLLQEDYRRRLSAVLCAALLESRLPPGGSCQP